MIKTKIEKLIWVIVLILSILFISGSFYLHSIFNFQSISPSISILHDGTNLNRKEKSRVVKNLTLSSTSLRNNIVKNDININEKKNNIIKLSKKNHYIPPKARGRGLSACLLIKDENNNSEFRMSKRYSTIKIYF